MQNPVKSGDLHKAYDRWCVVFGKDTWGDFWHFLETNQNEARQIYGHTLWLSEQGLRKLSILLGPNHYTILMAYKIKNRKNICHG